MIPIEEFKKSMFCVGCIGRSDVARCESCGTLKNFITDGIPLDRLEAICVAERDGTANTQRIRLLQYESLRRNFRALIRAVLGKEYYNMGADVYMCDEICCADIAQKCKRLKQFEQFQAALAQEGDTDER